MQQPSACVACGSQIPTQRRGRPRKYCRACVPDGSSKAWKAVNAERIDAYNAARRHDFDPKPCVVCGKTFKPRRQYDKYCDERCRNRRVRKTRTSGKRRIIGQRTCACGATFGWAPKLRETFCSKRCALNSRPGAKCEWRCEVPWRKCSECDRTFLHRLPQRVCSDECRKTKARRRFREAFVSVEQTNPIVTHVCPECGITFTSRRNSSRRKFCTERCSTRAHKRYRRHLLRIRPHEVVGIWEIGERDGWICQLCLKPIDRSLGFRHRMGKSLDHIIPVAGGGCHLRSNLQIAHRICNSRKGVGPAQLRIHLEAA